FASIGNGLAAAAMGAAGYLVSNQAVFFLTAALAAPAILALARIRMGDVERPRDTHVAAATTSVRKVLSDRRLLVFAGCILLFQLANAAMLPLMGGILTLRSSQWASTLIGACIVVPQLVVAGFAPWVGRVADSWGRRPLLLFCFLALALRGVLFAFVSDPYLIVVVQVLDGVCAAVLGVALPLVVADITRGTGRFNLGLGIVGSAVGIGAALSTTLAGYAIDHFGSSVAFFSLASIAVCGLALVWLLLPETRPDAGPIASRGLNFVASDVEACIDRKAAMRSSGRPMVIPVNFSGRTVKFLTMIAVERVPAELRRRFSRSINLVARAHPTGEFRPKWKRLVATAIARLKSCSACASDWRVPAEMEEACRYSDRPLAFLARYVKKRPLSHDRILIAVVVAVVCSVGAQYAVKILVDTLAGGLYVGTHARDAWLGFLLLATLIASDNLLWRVASWIASYTFVAVTGDLRRDLFRHLTGHAPSYFAERMPGTLTSRITAT